MRVPRYALELEDLRDMRKRFVAFVTNRLFVLSLVFVVMFCSLVSRLYDIQIINGQDAPKSGNANVEIDKKLVEIAARRGEIFDRYGRPLAVNEIAFTIKIDPTIKSKLSAETAVAFIQMMDQNGEKIIETTADFPISKTIPREFELNENEEREATWKRNMDLDEGRTAAESFDDLLEFFGVDESLSDELKWRALSLLSTVYMQRYYLRQVLIAVSVSESTIAFVEEHRDIFPGFYVDLDYLRSYPAGESLSHILGYIRGISASELEERKDLGYTARSIIGKSGVEQAFDEKLKGEEGLMTISVDATGRRLSSEREKEPVPGNDVFLTIDSELQNKCDAYLRAMLKSILLNKLSPVSAEEEPVPPEVMVASMIRANNISAEAIMSSPDGSWSSRIRDVVLSDFEIPKTNKNYKDKLKIFLAENAKSRNIPSGYFLLAMFEQGKITLTDDQIIELGKNDRSLRDILIEKVDSDEITPQMAALAPFDGSIIVLDIKNGGVIAAASYPTFDNNELVNNFNNAYFDKINNDTTSPMWYRAFSDPRAPGSTFKMITALTALETGAITKNTTVIDRGTFTDAGEPFANCWIKTAGFHHSVDVEKALEVSCNYFFYNTMLKLGSSKTGDLNEGIQKLNEYMTYFGLNDRTGVEISELYDASVFKTVTTRISSPSYKAYREKVNNPNSSENDLEWKDGDAIRTAIGQSYNNYTPANMAKYIMTLANGGDRWQLHFLKGMNAPDGTYLPFIPNLETHIDLAPENLQTVYNGMLRVTKGTDGTAKAEFDGFPIKIGAKTGTAQETGFEHVAFAAFAPFDDPQIAVYVAIPNGNTITNYRPAAELSRDIIAAYFGLDADSQKAYPINALMP